MSDCQEVVDEKFLLLKDSGAKFNETKQRERPKMLEIMSKYTGYAAGCRRSTGQPIKT